MKKYYLNKINKNSNNKDYNYKKYVNKLNIKINL